MDEHCESIHCSRCLRKTNHTILIERNAENEDYLDDAGHVIASSGVVWALYECLGCGNIVLRRRFWHTDMERGESETESCYNRWYPPLISRRTPDWHKELLDAESRLISEIYVALHAKAMSLATMGIRALLDMYMVRKVGDVGSFNQKLETLKELGYISAAQAVQIEPALNAGHAASHRGYSPPEETVGFALDVVELLLHQDILGSKSAQVGAGIPQRSKR